MRKIQAPARTTPVITTTAKTTDLTRIRVEDRVMTEDTRTPSATTLVPPVRTVPVAIITQVITTPRMATKATTATATRNTGMTGKKTPMTAPRIKVRSNQLNWVRTTPAAEATFRFRW